MATVVVAHRSRFTYRELQLMPDDGVRRELIDGDVFVTPAPVPWHQTVSRRLQLALMNALEETGLAEVYNAPVDIIFNPTNVVEPDLVIIGAEKAHIVTARAIEGIPDIVVEILSPGTAERDRYWKRQLYERFGVPEYWIVSPDPAFIEAFALTPQGYIERARNDRAGTLVCPLFPSLAVPLERVFRPRS
jgi:Uma2 family endonuclease